MRLLLRLFAVVTITIMATFCASGQGLSTSYVLRFSIDQATIDWNTPHNQQLLQDLNQCMSQVLPDQVDTVYITSGVSPRGTNRINLSLAVSRCTVTRSFISSNYNIPLDRIEIDANWKMWDTMIRAIEADSVVPQKQRTLELLNKHCASQEAINQTLINFERLCPDSYAYLRENLFPALCVATIKIKLK